MQEVTGSNPVSPTIFVMTTVPSFITDTTIGLYIHIPFCRQLCPYCNFCKKTYDQDHVSLFLTAVQTELSHYQRCYPELTLASVYYGGGTPTVIEPSALVAIHEWIQTAWPQTPTVEITLEANPLDITASWCDAIGHMGVTRVSLGAQSSHAPTLAVLGRSHQWSDVTQAVSVLRTIDPVAISLDMMYGLPELSTSHLIEVLADYTALQADHLSIYGLTIEPGTPFYQKQTIKTSDAMLMDYRLIRDTLSCSGFEQYEVSAYAKPGQASRHNQGYWQFRPYIGVGPGAHSFFRGHRFRQVSDLSAYHRQPIRPQPTGDIAMQARFEEWLMVGLRTRSGVLMAQGKAWFDHDVTQHEAILSLIDHGFLQMSDTHVSATARGYEVLDDVVTHVLASL